MEVKKPNVSEKYFNQIKELTCSSYIDLVLFHLINELNQNECNKFEINNTLKKIYKANKCKSPLIFTEKLQYFGLCNCQDDFNFFMENPKFTFKNLKEMLFVFYRVNGHSKNVKKNHQLLDKGAYTASSYNTHLNALMDMTMAITSYVQITHKEFEFYGKAASFYEDHNLWADFLHIITDILIQYQMISISKYKTINDLNIKFDDQIKLLLLMRLQGELSVHKHWFDGAHIAGKIQRNVEDGRNNRTMKNGRFWAEVQNLFDTEFPNPKRGDKVKWCKNNIQLVRNLAIDHELTGDRYKFKDSTKDEIEKSIASMEREIKSKS